MIRRCGTDRGEQNRVGFLPNTKGFATDVGTCLSVVRRSPQASFVKSANQGILQSASKDRPPSLGDSQRTKSCRFFGEHKGIRSSHFHMFECSSSFPANPIRSIKVKSADQGVLQSASKKPPSPSTGYLQAMINGSRWICSFLMVRGWFTMKIMFSNGRQTAAACIEITQPTAKPPGVSE
ncbi:hypothetical protein AVEN_256428-1 [Araneus ventricosus]|uniref:Uncharacterized protein n=1 Tax=Araneus ventricosus TaxID=182803 RepID=A0A4Y2JZF8_ARAVE|nr:hypothetical protein AVEN_256428-1 [Araneus ventricosus]